jgi:hypothetical protein
VAVKAALAVVVAPVVVAPVAVKAAPAPVAPAVVVEATTAAVTTTAAAMTTVVTVASPASQRLSEKGGPRERALFPRPRLFAMVTVWLVVLVGFAGGAVAWYDRGSEQLFSYEQSRLLTLTPATVLSAAHVEAVVAEAPEPVPPARRTRPAQVRCRPAGGGTLRNPWSCVIRYRSGTRAHYRVTVQPDGFYSGVGSGIITGCCVEAPTLD